MGVIPYSERDVQVSVWGKSDYIQTSTGWSLERVSQDIPVNRFASVAGRHPPSSLTCATPLKGH